MIIIIHGKMCLKFGGGVDKVQGGEILKNIYIFILTDQRAPPLH